MLHVLKYNGLEIAKNIEFARSLPSKILGLMFRKSIRPDFALIFVLNRPSHVGVHMFFMRFPIDVIFLDEGKRISGLSRLNQWTGYQSMDGIKYVIEMAAGTIDRYNLSTGKQVEFEDR
ncbi:MAG TPA: DUF192 domain-containing protein [Candidatus Methanoperedens sp.]